MFIMKNFLSQLSRLTNKFTVNDLESQEMIVGIRLTDGRMEESVIPLQSKAANNKVLI